MEWSCNNWGGGDKGEGGGENLSEYMFKKVRKNKFPKYQGVCISTSIYVQLYLCRDFHIAKSLNELPRNYLERRAQEMRSRSGEGGEYYRRIPEFNFAVIKKHIKIQYDSL